MAAVAPRVVMLMIALACVATAAKPQVKGAEKTLASCGKGGEFAGVASVRIDGAVYVACWTKVDAPKDDQLSISQLGSEPTGGSTHFRNDGSEWISIHSLETGLFHGFVLRSRHPDSWFGETTVYAFDGTKFTRVFRGGCTEYADLDADGHPELYVSEWPNGDGEPAYTDVFAWDGKEFAKLMRTAYRTRFSGEVVRAIEKARGNVQ